MPSSEIPSLICPHILYHAYVRAPILMTQRVNKQAIAGQTTRSIKNE